MSFIIAKATMNLWNHKDLSLFPQNL